MSYHATAAFAETLFWAYAVGSWCMSFYVLFSCGEGVRWFASFNNYLLIFGATCGLVAAPFHTVPSSSVLIVFTGWSMYSMLVTMHYLRFQLWRLHIIPVTLPLVFLFLWEGYRQWSVS